MAQEWKPIEVEERVALSRNSSKSESPLLAVSRYKRSPKLPFPKFRLMPESGYP